MRPIIYQLLPRLYANYCDSPVPGGTIHTNGSGKLNAITPKVLDMIRGLGVTHVWYTGVIEHAHDADYTRHGIARDNPCVIKGRAGSPYAITDYYDIDPDLADDVDARLSEFDALVSRTHRAGMKVIIDFVPNHVARQYRSDARPAGIDDFGSHDNHDMFFAHDNNFYYIPRQQFAPRDVDLGTGDDAYVEFPARASGNDCFTAFPGRNDWYDTVKLNYGIDYGDGSRHFDPVPDTWFKMLHILRYWVHRGVDGFRCDMVHMVPVEFWRWAVPQVKAANPDVIFIAEIYDTALYRPYIYEGGFDYLYDKVNLYDTLRGIECSGWSAARITSCWQTVDGIGSHMLTFLENHDEQRFASRQYAGDASRVTPSLVATAMLGTGAVMIYAGQELGEDAHEAEGYSGADGRTTIFDYWSIPTLRARLNHGRCDGALTEAQQRLLALYTRVLTLCNTDTALGCAGRFFDLMYVNYDNRAFDPHRQYAFIRSATDHALIAVLNFSDADADVSVNLPAHAFDVLGMPAGTFAMRELLGGATATAVTVSPDSPFTTAVAAHDAVVWRFDYTAARPERHGKKCRQKSNDTKFKNK